jgi:hypothetical protein
VYRSSTIDSTSSAVTHPGGRRTIAGLVVAVTRHDNLSALLHLATVLDAAIVFTGSAVVALASVALYRFR